MDTETGICQQVPKYEFNAKSKDHGKESPERRMFKDCVGG
jgi:hypothetical protein